MSDPYGFVAAEDMDTDKDMGKENAGAKRPRAQDVDRLERELSEAELKLMSLHLGHEGTQKIREAIQGAINHGMAPGLLARMANDKALQLRQRAVVDEVKRLKREGQTVDAVKVIDTLMNAAKEAKPRLMARGMA